MSKTIGRFSFKIMGGKASHTNAVVLITLGAWSSQNGTLCISPHLMTAREIDEHTDALKADLDTVARQAKAALAKAN